MITDDDATLGCAWGKVGSPNPAASLLPQRNPASTIIAFGETVQGSKALTLYLSLSLAHSLSLNVDLFLS